MTQSKTNMNTNKLYFICRLSDGLLYSHYDIDTRSEIWNKSGNRYNCESRYVYLAKLRPELYKIIPA